MHSLEILGSFVWNLVGLRRPDGENDADGRAKRDLLWAVLTVLALLMVAVWLVPLEGRGASAVGPLALALLAFSVGRGLRLQRRTQSVAREWQLTIDALDFPVLTLDHEGRVLRMNHAAMLLSGKSYSDSLGKPIAAVGAGEPWRTAAEQVARSHAEGRARNVELREEESWNITVRPVSKSGTARPTFIVIARDVTAVVALRDSLRQHEVMSGLGSLVAGVAHDVRNYLFAISGTVELLEASFGHREEYQPFVKTLRQQANQMRAFMQTLLDYGKPIELVSGSIAAVIEEALATCEGLAAGKGIEVSVSQRGEVSDIPMDRQRVFQVFKNLLENAIQHSPRGTQVSIETRRAGDWVECRIRDRGPGLQAGDRPKLFEPFYSRRSGGTGLGLSIVQRVMDEHAGEVEAANHPEGGALFRVRFPVAA